MAASSLTRHFVTMKDYGALAAEDRRAVLAGGEGRRGDQSESVATTRVELPVSWGRCGEMAYSEVVQAPKHATVWISTRLVSGVRGASALMSSHEGQVVAHHVQGR